MGCDCTKKNKNKHKIKPPKNTKLGRTINTCYSRRCCKGHVCKRSNIVQGFINIRDPCTPIDVYGNL
jgi:hypothetical protein